MHFILHICIYVYIKKIYERVLIERLSKLTCSLQLVLISHDQIIIIQPDSAFQAGASKEHTTYLKIHLIKYMYRFSAVKNFQKISLCDQKQLSNCYFNIAVKISQRCCSNCKSDHCELVYILNKKPSYTQRTSVTKFR